MFLRAGALSLALLLASRLLGVARESALAAAFGSGGLADVAVLMLTLPDWVASVVASGALAYVLLPAWAQQPAQVAALQRRVAVRGSAVAAALAVALALAHGPLVEALGGGIPPAWRAAAAQGLLWSALAVPAALLAALWATRLQHERDFVGMYGANLVVNLVLVAAIVAAARTAGAQVHVLGAGLAVAMGARLWWLGRRLPAVLPPADRKAPVLPPLPVWTWAWLSAGLPLALPFVARSVASQGGEGSLAVFNYAWKLVELPLILAIQLVATLAFPAISRALGTAGAVDHVPVRRAFALAWVLGCAAAAGLLVAGPGLAQLLFGWGRMPPESLAQVARWGMAGAWGLLPQAVTAVALTVSRRAAAWPRLSSATAWRWLRCWPAPPRACRTACG